MLRGMLVLMLTGSGLTAETARDAGREFFVSRGITFYAPFEESLDSHYSDGRSHPINAPWSPVYQQLGITYPKGKFGNCASAQNLRILYDPAKVFFPDRGAVSFWFKPVKGDIATLFQVTAREWGVGPNSLLQRDLYWDTFLFGTSSLIRKGTYRALIRPALDPIEECFNLGELDRDSWFHFAWTWDNTQGMRGYLNGKRIFDNWGTVTWIHMMTPNVVKFHSMSSIDELYFFKRSFTPAEILRLSRGDVPSPVEEEKEYSIPEPQQRDIAHSYGLDEIPNYPLITADAPVTFTVIDFKKAIDGKRPMLYCLDGNRVSCWPDSHVELVNTDYLDITYPGEVKANYFRVIADGKRFAVSRNGELKPFWTDEVRTEQDGWEDKLVRRFWSKTPLYFDRLRLDRKGARIGEFYVYHVEEGSLQMSGRKPRIFSFDRVTDIRSLEWEGGVYQYYHNHPSPVALGSVTTENGNLPVIPGNPLVPFHLVSPPFDEQTGIAAVSLNLALTAPENKLEDILRLRIVDPITKERDLVNTEFKVRFDPGSKGSQVFRLSFDMTDFVFNKGSRLWVWLVSKSGSDVDLSQSALIVHTLPVEAAAKEMVKNTMRLVAHTYSWSSEGHRWSHSFKWPGEEMIHYTWSEWAGLLNIVKNRLAPDNKLVGTYWHAIRPREHYIFKKWVDYSKNEDLRKLEHTRIEAPEEWPNPAKAPEWALYQNELLRSFVRIVHWWHDNRLVYETGILGGYGDDTQFTGDAFWIYFATGDPKLFRILEAVSDGTWKSAGVQNGFPARVNDVGHDAEEVVGAWPLMILADYGNPKYVEMTMQSMSLMDFFTTETALGHRHFRSWYMGASGIKTRGRYGVDNLANAQFALLGHSLGWYNRCPKLVEFYRDWCDAWLADFKRAKEMNVKGPLSIQMPDDVPIPHVGGMSSQTMQHQFFVTGLLTGDNKYIDRALTNDDGVFVKYSNGRWDQGMLLRDFAVMRHMLLEDERLKNLRLVKRPGIFTKHYLTKDKTGLAKEYKRLLDVFAGGLEYLYSQGQPSLDRLWGMMHYPMFLGILGGNATGHRTSSTWPGLAISFVDAGTDLASLVLENRAKEMKVLLFNFNRQRKSATIRLWQLEPGEYELTAGPDRDGDDQMDAVTYTKKLNVERATRVTLPVPYGVSQVAHIQQLSRKDVPQLLPDLAIGKDDLSYNKRNGSLEVIVHNIGSKGAEAFEVKLLSKRGRSIALKKLAGLEAPVDLKPRTILVRFQMKENALKRIHSVSVTSINRDQEITRENNTCDYSKE
ncbi:MAG: hypothetical protein QGG53_15605 [Planctomycetota bacterium]|nr:hypothetical protein [Planctomycetota bacterium]